MAVLGVPAQHSSMLQQQTTQVPSCLIKAPCATALLMCQSACLRMTASLMPRLLDIMW